MNICSFLINATDARLCQLEQETELLEYEIDALSKVRGVSEDNAREIMCKHDIFVSVHKILANYLAQLKEQRMEVCPFKAAISCHLLALKREEASIGKLLTEIEERQMYLYYLRHSANPSSMDELRRIERSDDVNGLVNYFSKYFPYRMFYELCCDGKFVGEVMKAVLNFNPETFSEGVKQYKQCVKNVFQCIRDTCEVLTRDLLQCVALAETFVSYFLGSELRKLAMDPVIDFQFAEISRWMVEDKLSLMKIKQEYVAKITRTETHPNDTNVKKIERRQEIAYGYENSTNFVIPAIQHVIYEIRRLTTQSSVSMMNSILWQIMDWLNSALSVDGENVGADESFQFFVAALAEAKLLCLPTILMLIKDCVLDDLKSSKINFLITQLSIAEEFVKTRKTEVPPYILLPGVVSTIGGAEIEYEDTLVVPCFTLFAFPTYASQKYQYVSCCTGNSLDSVTLYKYKTTPELMSEMGQEAPVVDIVATTNGLLPNVNIAQATELRLIRIDRSIEHDKMLEEVGLFSNLMLMTKTNIPRPKISQMQDLLEIYARFWRLPSNTRDLQQSVLDSIKEIQSALIKKRVLRMDHKVDGFIDEETILGIRTLIPQFKNNEFFIDSRIKSFVCKK